MVTYRTTDADRWGAGKGSNLTAGEVDTNFWDLLARIVALETNPAEPTEIASFTVAGSQMTVHMADGTSHGPLTLPTALIRFRGDWTAATTYFELDLVTVPGDGLYLVLLDHISGATFDPVATDGSGNLLHRYLLPLTGGAVADLTDVDLEALPLDDGDTLVYDAGTGTWIPGLPAMGLDDLAQVFPGTPDDGDVLTWVAADVAWRSRPVAPAVGVSDEGGQVLAAPTDINFAGAGVTVTDDGDGTATVTIPGGAAALGDLSDVDPVAPIDGQALVFDTASGAWKPRTISAGEGGVSTTVSPSWHGARAWFTGVTFPTPNSLSTIAFTAVAVDTDALVSGNTFVIPAGVTKVRLRAMIRRQSGADGNDQIALVRNGTILDDHLGGFVAAIPDGYSNNGAGLSSAVLDVVPGDIFLLAGTASSSTPTFDGWFEIEVVEGALLDQVVGGIASVSGEGVQILAGPSDINFAGAGVVVTDDGDGSATVMIKVDWPDLASVPAAVAAVADLTPAADTLPYFTGADTADLATLTPYARTLLDDADAAAARATLAAAGTGVANTFTETQTITGRLMATGGGYLKGGFIAMPGQEAADMGMTGFYDRDELVTGPWRGTLTTTITGAGSANPDFENAFDGGGLHGSITGTDTTTTTIVVHLDLGVLQENYASASWQPYVQMRLTTGAGFTGTWYKSVTVEVSDDNASWYKPSGGEWETTDFHNEGEAITGVPGLWMGVNASPTGGPSGNRWRYIRFTFTDRQENAAYPFRDRIWFAQIGMRHTSGPFARQYVSSFGGTIYGGLAMTGATGGEQGDGTINATAVYDDAVLLCAPIVETVSGGYDRTVWEVLAPNGGVDQHEALKARGFVPGSADSYATEIEAQQGIPGYWNLAEWAARLQRQKPRIVRDFEGNETVVMVADRVSLAERQERLLLALDYAALAIRDLAKRVQALEAGASSRDGTVAAGE